MRPLRNTFIGGIFYSMPPVVRWLILSSLLIWLLMLVASPGNPWFALLPLWDDVFRTLYLWQFVTYLFVHAASPFHVLLNGYATWLFGRELERQWGSWRFLRFYLVCGAFAGLAHVLLSRLVADPRPVIGASGAIYGVTVAYAMTWPKREMFIIPIPVPIQVRYLVMIYIVFDLAMAFSRSPENRVANFAHLGGAFAGWVYVLAARRVYRMNWRLPDLSMAAWRRRRVKSRMRAVETDKDFDKWLRDIDPDDEKRH